MLQDFELLFGVETSAKLEKWGSSLKHKVIGEAKNLTQSFHLSRLIESAEQCESSQEVTGNYLCISIIVCFFYGF